MNRKNRLNTEQQIALNNWLLANKTDFEKEPTTALEILPRIERAPKFYPSAEMVMRIAQVAKVPISAVKPQTARMHKTTIVARAVVELYNRLGEEPDGDLVRIANPTLPNEKEEK